MRLITKGSFPFLSPTPEKKRIIYLTVLFCTVCKFFGLKTGRENKTWKLERCTQEGERKKICRIWNDGKSL